MSVSALTNLKIPETTYPAECSILVPWQIQTLCKGVETHSWLLNVVIISHEQCNRPFRLLIKILLSYFLMYLNPSKNYVFQFYIESHYLRDILHAQHCITYTPTMINHKFPFKCFSPHFLVSFTYLSLHVISLLLSAPCKTLQQTFTM